MYCLSNVCFMCFCNDNLKSVIHDDEKDLAAKQLKFLLPELTDLDLKSTLHICPKCSADLGSAYVFKKLCLEKYQYFITNIHTLQGPNESEAQRTNQSQIKVENIEVPEAQEDGIIANIKQEVEDPLSEEHLPERGNDELASYEGRPAAEFVFVKCEESDVQDSGPSDKQIPVDAAETGIKSQTERRRFKCGICNKQFIFKHKLKCHMIVHSTVKDFKCSKCNREFLRKHDLESHFYNIHSESKVKINCTICNKQFANKKTLTRHLKIHSGVKDFCCTVCNREFLEKRRFKLHMKGHAGIKDFQCNICGKEFLTKYNLNAHNNTHTGSKKYSCTVCNKQFLHKQSLDRHMKIHAGVKDFKCSICGKEFAQKYHLQSHINYIHPWLGKV